MDILIYRIDKSHVNTDYDFQSIEFKVWQPTLFNLVHPYYPKKYLFFSLFHFFRIFGNKHFYVVDGFVADVNVCSLMIVPKFYKWSFMQKKDVQLTYVVSKGFNKGKGYGFKLVNFAINFLDKKDFTGKVWYVTDSENSPSQRLALKSGFQFYSNGKLRESFFGFIRILDAII